MLTSLRRGPLESAAEPSAIELLLECHGRIRQFTNIAMRLAEAKGVAPEEIRDTASRLIRYFTIALPLHSEDEERSLHPRLRDSEAPRPVQDAIDEMVVEHGPIHATIDELVASWKLLLDEPAILPELALRLQEGARELALLFDTHLAKEETIIFPAATRYLRPEAIAEILQELRARREKVMTF